MDQKMEERVQSREVITDKVKKASKPFISKLQSFETKMQKNLKGRCQAKAPLPSAVDIGKQPKSKQALKKSQPASSTTSPVQKAKTTLITPKNNKQTAAKKGVTNKHPKQAKKPKGKTLSN